MAVITRMTASAHPRNTWVGVLGVLVLVGVTVALLVRSSGMFAAASAVADTPSVTTSAAPTLPPAGSDEALQRSATLAMGRRLTDGELARLHGLPADEAEWRIRQSIQARVYLSQSLPGARPATSDLRWDCRWSGTGDRLQANCTITNPTSWSAANLVVRFTMKRADGATLGTTDVMLDELPPNRAYTVTVDVPKAAYTWSAGALSLDWVTPVQAR